MTRSSLPYDDPAFRAVNGGPRSYSLELGATDTGMVPALRPGFVLRIDPDRSAEIGDVVFVALGGERTLVRELAAMSDHWLTLRQCNPPQDVAVPRDTVKFMHVIIGSARVSTDHP